MKSTHSQQLERWLGADQVANISHAMRGWYGGPIPLANAGGVWATPDGDFMGVTPGGAEAALADKLHSIVKREQRKRLGRMAHARKQLGGFSSVGDLISEMTTGAKAQFFNLAKTGVTGVANCANSLWDVGVCPETGGNSVGGTEVVPTNATAGGLKQVNPSGQDSLHFISATIVGTVANNTLLMYDRFYFYGHNTATQSPSGLGQAGNAPTRYQTAGTSPGTFLTAFVTGAGALGGTQVSWQPTYTDQDGNSQSATAQTPATGAIARRFPWAASVGNGWYFPLAAGDNGIRALTAITQGGATSTGVLDVVLAKPLVWIPIQLANVPMVIGGVTSALNLATIASNACLAFMEVNKGATTATSYSGQVILCSG